MQRVRPDNNDRHHRDQQEQRHRPAREKLIVAGELHDEEKERHDGDGRSLDSLPDEGADPGL